MNTKEIKEILQLMKDFDVSEFEIEKEGLKIRLKKPTAGELALDPQAYAQGLRLNTAGTQPAPKTEIPAAGPVDDTYAVKSPMVGTYYGASAPDQPPFVSLGQKVNEGDVLCIIEAMKLMNEIKSEISGTVVEILIPNGRPVEFDQTLFKIRKG